MARQLLAVVTLVAVTACGGGSDGKAASDSPKYGTEEFGLSDAELDSRIAKAEAGIARCMTSAGFDYVPVDAQTIRDAMNADATKPGISDEEYVAQFGFGITTVFDDPVLEQGRGQNAATYAALLPTEQVAYDRALMGEPGMVGLARAFENEDLSNTGGCTRAAVEPLFKADELTSAYVNPADVLLEQDPRMVAAIKKWSACMSDAGYNYAHPDNVTEELTDRLNALLGGADASTLTGSAAVALAALQNDERTVAVVATACEETHIVPVEDKVQSEIYGAPQS